MTMDELEEAVRNSLYDDVRRPLTEGYQNAQRAVDSFAIEHDVTSLEVWDLVAREASVRGDDAVEYIAENPLDDSSPSIAEVLAPAVATGALILATKLWDWRQRRRG